MRVLITGAAGGIGAATAAALRARGARVVGLDIAAGDGLRPCDVRDQSSVDGAVGAALAELGGLDALINCAGLGHPSSATEPPDERALAVLDVNLLGSWRVTSAALPALLVSGGRVVNVASGLALLALPFAAAYGVSKRAVVGYSAQLRAEVGDRVSVTTVYPGFVRTGIHDSARAQGLGLDGLAPEEPLSATVDTLLRAVYGRPARHLATTRRAAVAYALLRYLPEGVTDSLVAARVARAARRGRFDRAPLAAALLARRGQPR